MGGSHPKRITQGRLSQDFLARSKLAKLAENFSWKINGLNIFYFLLCFLFSIVLTVDHLPTRQHRQTIPWADLGGGGDKGAAAPPFFCIFEKFLTLSLTFGHKCSQNDVKQHHQFLRPPLSGFSGSAPEYSGNTKSESFGIKVDDSTFVSTLGSH